MLKLPQGMQLEITCFDGEKHRLLQPTTDLITTKKYVFHGQDSKDDLALCYRIAAGKQ
jgi:hypothetical protein